MTDHTSSYQTRPYKTGCIKEFMRLFVAPLIKYKPANKNLEDFIDYIFHAETRPIHKYRVLKKFKIPGKLWRGYKRIEGAGERRIKEGTLAFVRNEIKSGIYHIEVYSDKNKQWQVFTLMPKQYEDIKKYLAQEPFQGSLRDYHTWNIDRHY